MRLNSDLGLNIGSAQVLASFLLQDVIAKLKKEHPRLDLNVQIRSSEALTERLIRKEIDVVFLLGDEAPEGYKQMVVKSGYFKLIKPKKFKNKKVLYAITEDRPETKRAKVLFERKFKKKLPVFAQIGSWNAIWKWMIDGHCGGLIPDFLITKSSNKTKSFEVVIDRVCPFEMKVLVAQSKLKDPATAAFLGMLKDTLKTA